MLRCLSLAVVLFLSAFLLRSQDPLSVSMVDDVVVAVMDDGTVTASTVVDGTVQTSRATSAARQGPVASGGTPTLSSTYVDVNGVSHTVTTPVASTTPAGLAAAMSTHDQLLALMKQRYPPRQP